MRRHLTLILFLVLFAGFFGAFLFYPVGYSVQRAFTQDDPDKGLQFTSRHFATLFRDPTIREGLTNSLSIAIAVTALTTAIALPLAFWAVRYRFPLKGLLTGLILAPLILPPFVGAIGVKQLLARYGTVNLLLMDLGLVREGGLIDFLGGGRFWGVVILEALHLFPIMYLNVVAALANVDPSLEEAGRNLGASGWRLFRTVTFPLMVPGYFAGAVIVFIWAFTDLGTPLVFGFQRVLPVQIYNNIEQVETNPTGFALVVVVLVLTLLLFLLARLVMRGKRYEMMSRAGRGRQEKRPRLPHAVLIYAAFLVVFVLAVSPHVGVVLTSLADDWFMTAVPSSFTLDHYREAAAHPLTFASMRRSVLLASGSTVLDVLLGLWIAYMLTRKRFAGRGVIDAITMLPLALPGVILAFGYLGAFKIGPQSNPMPYLVLAYALRRLPYMVRSAMAGLQQTSVTLEEASLNLGAGPVRTFRRITVPLVSANLIAGAVLAFSFAVLEVSDSLILALREPYYPLTKAIYSIFSRLGDGAYVASALGVWASLFLAVTLVTAGVFLGRRLGELFRAN
jgi:iron(III) transport system permease protein